MLPISLIIVVIVAISVTVLFILGSFKSTKEQIKYRFVSLLMMPFLLTGCMTTNEYNLDESTFFLIMTNIQYYPEEYINKEITLDCFTYSVKDIDDNEYLCGVRKCTAGFGCKCGRDTVIGFILKYDGTLPEPKNQYIDTNDKSWIHISGGLESTTKTKIEVHSFDAEGNVLEQTEIVEFLTFNISTLEIITDYSGLAYFVSK